MKTIYGEEIYWFCENGKMEIILAEWKHVK